MKYNIGDKVKITDIGCRYSTYDSWVKIHAPHKINTYNKRSIPNGAKAEVVARGKHSPNKDVNVYLIQSGDSSISISEEGIEPLKDYFTKSDLKTGMVVKLRNGDTLLVLIDTIGLGSIYREESILLYEREQALKLSYYSQSLKYKTRSNNDYDIIEVRKLPCISNLFDGYNYSELEILWNAEDTKYILGVQFGSDTKCLWKSGGVKCNVGDIVEVETTYGKDIAKVVDTLYTNNKSLTEDPCYNMSVIRKVKV